MINGKYIVIFFNRSYNFNWQIPPQRTWPSGFQSLLPIVLFTDWNGQASIYIFEQTEKIFFKTSRYSVLAWIFSGFYFAKAGVSSIYYFHIPYSFFTPLPFTSICDQPSSQRSDQSSSWFEADRIVMTSLNIFRQRLASAQIQVCDYDSLYWHRFNNPQSKTGDSM